MTDEELKKLVASLAVSQAKTDEQLKESSLQLRRELNESSLQLRRELNESSLQLRRELNENSLQLRELKESQAENDRQLTAKFKETAEQIKENSLQLRELKESQARTNKQIGGLHKKFGLYVEALAFPSMQRVLSNTFGTDSFDSRCKRRNKEGVIMEVDAIASSNSGANQVFMIEIKSLLTQDGLTQTLKNLKRFKQFFPEHKDRELFGVLVYTDIKPAGLKQQVLKRGIYLAHVSDDLFQLEIPDTFQARSF